MMKILAINLPLHDIPFVKAQNKCQHDKNPTRDTIEQIRTRQEIIPDDIVSM